MVSELGKNTLSPSIETFAICKICKRSQIKNKAERIKSKPDGFWYIDGKGRKWRGLLCPDCRAEKQRERLDRLGLRRARSESTYEKHRKGFQSEVRVREFLKSLGCSFQKTNYKGSDIKAELMGFAFSVEVKSVSRSKKGRSSVAILHKNCEQDDLICYDFNGTLIFREMKSHLSNLHKHRCATVTAFDPDYKPRKGSIHREPMSGEKQIVLSSLWPFCRQKEALLSLVQKTKKIDHL